MAEDEQRVLKLHSPNRVEQVTYRWPLVRNDTVDEATEIIDTIKWVCNDFSNMKFAMDKWFDDVDPNSFESMHSLCERYNRSIYEVKKLWAGQMPPTCLTERPSRELLKHIITQAYNHAIPNPERLNYYEPFSPEVYGETSYDLVSRIIEEINMTEDDVFLDLGSGVGQVVLQVAAATNCHKCIGIEKANVPAKFSKEVEREFVRWMAWYGKQYGQYELIHADFLDESMDEKISSATILFCNNFAFGPHVNHQLKLRFAHLKEGTRIVSSREFCPLNFRITERNLTDIGCIIRVSELSPMRGSVSWTGNPVSYFLHVIDRTMLEDYFHQQKDGSNAASRVPSEEPTSDWTISPGPEDSESEESDEIDAFGEREVTRCWVQGRNGVRPVARRQRQRNHVTRFGFTNGSCQDLSRRSSNSNRSGWSHIQQKSLKLVKAAKVARARKTGRQPPRKVVNAAPTELEKSVDRLMVNFRQDFLMFALHMKSEEFASCLRSQVEAEEQLRQKLTEEHCTLENEVNSLMKGALILIHRELDELGISDHTPEAMVKAVQRMLKQNQDLKKQMADLQEDVQQLEVDEQCARADTGITDRQAVKNGHVVGLCDDLTKQIVNEFEQRDQLQRQRDELQKEVDLLAEADELLKELQSQHSSPGSKQSERLVKLNQSKQSERHVELNQSSGEAIQHLPQSPNFQTKRRRGRPRKCLDSTVASDLAADPASFCVAHTATHEPSVAAEKKQASTLDTVDLSDTVTVSEEVQSANGRSKEQESLIPNAMNSELVTLQAAAGPGGDSNVHNQIVVDDADQTKHSVLVAHRTEDSVVDADRAEEVKENVVTSSRHVTLRKPAARRSKAKGTHSHGLMRFSSRIAVKHLATACPEDAKAVQETLALMDENSTPRVITSHSREVRNLGDMFPLPRMSRSQVLSVSEMPVKGSVVEEEVAVKKPVWKEWKKKTMTKSESKKLKCITEKATEPVIAALDGDEKQKEETEGTAASAIAEQVCGEFQLVGSNSSLETNKANKAEQIESLDPSEAGCQSKRDVSSPVATTNISTELNTSLVSSSCSAVSISSIANIVPVPALITERCDFQSALRCEVRRQRRRAGAMSERGPSFKRRYFKSRWEGGGTRCVTTYGKGRSRHPHYSLPLREIAESQSQQPTNQPRPLVENKESMKQPQCLVQLTGGVESRKNLHRPMPLMDIPETASQHRFLVPLMDNNPFKRQSHWPVPLSDESASGRQPNCPLPLMEDIESARRSHCPVPLIDESASRRQPECPLSLMENLESARRSHWPVPLIDDSTSGRQPDCSLPLLENLESARRSHWPVPLIDDSASGRQPDCPLPLMENLESARQSHWPVPLINESASSRQPDCPLPLMENIESARRSHWTVPLINESASSRQTDCPLPLMENTESARQSHWPVPLIEHTEPESLQHHRVPFMADIESARQPHCTEPVAERVQPTRQSKRPIPLMEAVVSARPPIYPVPITGNVQAMPPCQDLLPVSYGLDQSCTSSASSTRPALYHELQLREDKSHRVDHHPSSYCPSAQSSTDLAGSMFEALSMSRTDIPQSNETPILSVGDEQPSGQEPNDCKQPSQPKAKRVLSLKSYWETRRTEKGPYDDGEKDKEKNTAKKKPKKNYDVAEHRQHYEGSQSNMEHCHKHSQQLNKRSCHSRHHNETAISNDQQLGSPQSQRSLLVSSLKSVSPQSREGQTEIVHRPPPPVPPPPPLPFQSAISGSGVRVGKQEPSKAKSQKSETKTRGRAVNAHDRVRVKSKTSLSHKSGQKHHEHGSPSKMIFGIPVPSSVAKRVNSALPLPVQNPLHEGHAKSKANDDSSDTSPAKKQKTLDSGVETVPPSSKRKGTDDMEVAPQVSEQNTMNRLDCISAVSEEHSCNTLVSISPTSEQQTGNSLETDLSDNEQKSVARSTALDSEQGTTSGSLEAVPSGTAQKTLVSLKGSAPVGELEMTGCLEDVLSICTKNDVSNSEAIIHVNKQKTVVRSEVPALVSEQETSDSLETTPVKWQNTLNRVDSLEAIAFGSKLETTQALKHFLFFSEKKPMSKSEALSLVSDQETVARSEAPALVCEWETMGSSEATPPVAAGQSTASSLDSLESVVSVSELRINHSLEDVLSAGEKTLNNSETCCLSSEQEYVVGSEATAVVTDQETTDSLEAVSTVVEQKTLEGLDCLKETAPVCELKSIGRLEDLSVCEKTVSTSEASVLSSDKETVVTSEATAYVNVQETLEAVSSVDRRVTSSSWNSLKSIGSVSELETSGTLEDLPVGEKTVGASDFSELEAVVRSEAIPRVVEQETTNSSEAISSVSGHSTLEPSARVGELNNVRTLEDVVSEKNAVSKSEAMSVFSMRESVSNTEAASSVSGQKAAARSEAAALVGVQEATDSLKATLSVSEQKSLETLEVTTSVAEMETIGRWEPVLSVNEMTMGDSEVISPVSEQKAVNYSEAVFSISEQKAVNGMEAVASVGEQERVGVLSVPAITERNSGSDAVVIPPVSEGKIMSRLEAPAASEQDTARTAELITSVSENRKRDDSRPVSSVAELKTVSSLEAVSSVREQKIVDSSESISVVIEQKTSGRLEAIAPTSEQKTAVISEPVVCVSEQKAACNSEAISLVGEEEATDILETVSAACEQMMTAFTSEPTEQKVGGSFETVHVVSKEKTVNKMETVPSAVMLETMDVSEMVAAVSEVTTGSSEAASPVSGQTTVGCLEAIASISDQKTTGRLKSVLSVSGHETSASIEAIAPLVEKTATGPGKLKVVPLVNEQMTVGSLETVSLVNGHKTVGCLDVVSAVTEQETACSFDGVSHVSEQKTTGTWEPIPSVNEQIVTSSLEAVDPFGKQETLDGLEARVAPSEQKTVCRLEAQSPIDDYTTSSSLNTVPPVSDCVPGKDPTSLTLDVSRSDDFECLTYEQVCDYNSQSNLPTGDRSNGPLSKKGESPEIGEVCDNPRRSPALTSGTTETMHDETMNMGTNTSVVDGSVPDKRSSLPALDFNSCDDLQCLSNEHGTETNLSTGEEINRFHSGEGEYQSEVYDNDRRSPASTPGTMDTEKDEMASQGTSVCRSLVDSEYGSSDSEEEHDSWGAPDLENTSSSWKTQESVLFSASGLLSLAEVACQLTKEPVDGSNMLSDAKGTCSKANEREVNATIDQSRTSVNNSINSSQFSPSPQCSVSLPVELSLPLHCEGRDLIDSPTVEPHVDVGNEGAAVPQSPPLERTDGEDQGLVAEVAKSQNLKDSGLGGDGLVLRVYEVDRVSTSQEMMSTDPNDDTLLPVTEKSSDVEQHHHGTTVVDTCARKGDDTATSAEPSSRAVSAVTSLWCGPVSELPVSTAKRRRVCQDHDQRHDRESHKMILRQSGGLSRLRSEEKQRTNSKVLWSEHVSSSGQSASSGYPLHVQSTEQKQEKADGVAQRRKKSKSHKTDKKRRRKKTSRKSDLEFSVEDKTCEISPGPLLEQSEVKRRLCKDSEVCDRKRKSKDREGETWESVRSDRKRKRSDSSSDKGLERSRVDRHRSNSGDHAEIARLLKQQKEHRTGYQDSTDTHKSCSTEDVKSRLGNRRSSRSDSIRPDTSRCNTSRSGTSRSCSRCDTSRSGTSKYDKKIPLPRSPGRRPRSSMQEHDQKISELDNSDRRKSSSKISRDKKTSQGKPRRSSDKTRDGRR